MKTKKIFFYDLEIRNALIDNMERLSYRNDVGQLWENYLIIERLKTLMYRGVLEIAISCELIREPRSTT